MITDDPVNKPLPNIRLLQMQWVLQRLAAICGSAEALELKMDREDEEDVGSLCCIDEESEKTPATLATVCTRDGGLGPSDRS